MTLHRVGPPTVRFVAVSPVTSETWMSGFIGAVLGIPVGLIAGLAWLALR